MKGNGIASNEVQVRHSNINGYLKVLQFKNAIYE